MDARRIVALAALLLLQQFAKADVIDVDLSADPASPTSNLNTTSWQTFGPSWTVTDAGAISQCGAGAASRFTFGGKQVVIEANMAYTQYMHDAAINIIDVAQGADLIKFGETNYAGYGFYVAAVGSFGLGQGGIGSMQPTYTYYRATLDGTSFVVERGPAPGNYVERIERTLASSIEGRTFYMVIGTNYDFCPTVYKSITVTTTPVVPPLPFDGFCPPIANDPAINFAQAGRVVPIKFSLGGDRGSDIFAPGYPASGEASCDAGSVPMSLETVPVDNLIYDNAEGQYVLPWKTSKAWAGQCRLFVMKLIDGSVHSARFNFR